MKRAKLLLTILSSFALIGGVMAYKSNDPDIIRIFYKKTSANGACNVSTALAICITFSAGVTTPLSTAPTTATTCGTIRVTICL